MTAEIRADISIQNIFILVLVLEGVEMLKSCPRGYMMGVLWTTGFQHGCVEVLKDFFAVGILEKGLLKVENVLKRSGILKVCG